MRPHRALDVRIPGKLSRAVQLLHLPINHQLVNGGQHPENHVEHHDAAGRDKAAQVSEGTMAAR